MAIARFSPIVQSISGRLGGAVFKSTQGSTVVASLATTSRKTILSRPPLNPLDPVMLPPPTSTLPLIARLWQNLSQEQRDSWTAFARSTAALDRFGRPRRPSGYHQYLAFVGGHPLGANLPTLDPPEALPGEPIVFRSHILIPQVGLALEWEIPTATFFAEGNFALDVAIEWRSSPNRSHPFYNRFSNSILSNSPVSFGDNFDLRPLLDTAPAGTTYALRMRWWPTAWDPGTGLQSRIRTPSPYTTVTGIYRTP